MMETKGLGAGSYPTPPEPKEEMFRLNIDGSFRGTVDIYAKSVTDAVNKIQDGEYEYSDIEINYYEIEDIKDCEEI